MDENVLLICFIAFVLIFQQNGIADKSAETSERNHVKGIIGAIVDNTSRIGKEESVAMKMALEDFYYFHNQSFALYTRNSRGDPLQAAAAARNLIKEQQVQGILGPRTWEETSLVAEIGSQNQIPILSFSDATPKWATERWPFLVQAAPIQFAQMTAVAAIVQSWEWHQVSIIYEEKDSSSSGVLAHLSKALGEVGAEISNTLAIPPFISSSLEEELQKLEEGQCRVFVVHLSFPLAMHLFETAKKMKMMEKDYVWITTDLFTSLVHSLNVSAISSMQGIIGLRSYFPDMGKRYENFYYRFRQRFSSEHPEEYNHEPGIFAVQAYDAAWTAALAISEGNSKGGQLLSEKILLTNFTGLSGQVYFVNQKLPPAHTFQIINVIGKSYRELGFWSDGLGFSEAIDKTPSYTSSMKKYEQVFWPEGPSYNPRGWTVATEANPLRIGVPSGAIFKNYVNVVQDQSGNKTIFSGFAIDLFKATVEKLSYHLPYSFFHFNGTYDDLVKQIYLKKFDAVVGDVAIVSRRYQHAEFTHPYSEPGVVMLVLAQSKTRNRPWLFLKPFTKTMWVLIGAVTVYNGFVVWLIERKHCHELNKGSAVNQTGTMLSLSFTTLLSLHGGKLHSNLSRMTTVVWLFVALVITQTYTANLTSMLTVQLLEPSIIDVEELRISDAMVGYCRGSFVKRYLEDVLHFHPENILLFSSPEEYAEGLRSKKIAAAFLEVPIAKLFLAKYCKEFTIAGPTYKVGGFGFAFPKGSPLLPSTTEALLKVSEDGTLRYLENKMIASEKCQDIEVDDQNPSLSPSSFWVLFIFTGSTSTIALLVYISCTNNLLHGQKTMWKLLIAVIKHWGAQSRRFSRRVSNVAEKSY
ncbi:Glutamate receptor [Quillaja saponaria]|uniref:Glutamate receptor n=1 Tax=Quillaja saponaria TaxID=32244 RepID=A0AAD7KZD0_QUISA|nr:Glutamate receptor [Quillaja saponaria]